MPSSSSRDALLAAAARLFAERGFTRTSVGDVQTACGMTAGSGALYKHFASKEALLEAVVETHVVSMREGSAWFATDLPDELEEALRATAHAVVEAMRRDRDAVRVMLRELDAFPDLRDRMWAEVQQHVYAPFAAWVALRVERDDLPVEDPHATAAVLMGALTAAPILDALLGRRPGDLDVGRHVEAWTRTALATLTG